mmetsp:Transcript_13370/g.9645  ORF Transcript_13370/g.9645 Transcript_13370/m.9645 type:complete len:81 (+) Transcript_13370:28-270(+)
MSGRDKSDMLSHGQCKNCNSPCSMSEYDREYHLLKRDVLFCRKCLKDICYLAEVILDLGNRMYFYARKENEIYREKGVYN